MSRDRSLDELIRGELFDVIYGASMNPIALMDVSQPDREPFPEIRRVNAAFTALTGFGPDDVVGKGPAVLRGPETDPAAVERLLDACRRHVAVSEEACLHSRDGAVVWVQATLTPLEVPGASLIIAIYQDIGVRRHAQAELAERTAMLELAEEIGHIGHWSWDLETDHVYWSDEIYRIHGLDHTDEARRGNPIDYYHGDDREDFRRFLGGAKRTGEDFAFELRIVLPDGGVRYVDTRGFCRKAPDGTPLEIFGIFHDLTERRVAEIRANAVRERLADALDSIDGGAVLFDKEDRLVFANRHFLEAFPGQPEAFEPGTTFQEMMTAIMSGPDRRLTIDDLPAWIEARMDRHRRAEGLEPHRGDDGKWVRVVEHRTREGGILLIRLDVTEQYEAQEELRRAKKETEFASRSKSGFLANMSHELRTPLNAVIGFGEMIKLGLRGELPAEYRRYAQDIVDSAEHLLKIINDILDIAKVEGGSMTVEPALEDVDALIRSTVPLVAQAAIANGVTVDIDVPPGLPALTCDGLRMKQILLNLLSNA
ncbi:MAG: PAS domain S-box protein, partial [Magnetovibrio sp.]|nr:PAS domain S-box protein [Magnetovibrio sp.]